MSKDTDEPFKLANKVIDVVDKANRKICVTLLRYIVKKTRGLICSSPIICKKEAGRKVSTSCLCEFKK